MCEHRDELESGDEPGPCRECLAAEAAEAKRKARNEKRKERNRNRVRDHRAEYMRRKSRGYATVEPRDPKAVVPTKPGEPLRISVAVRSVRRKPDLWQYLENETLEFPKGRVKELGGVLCLWVGDRTYEIRLVDIVNAVAAGKAPTLEAGILDYVV